MTLQSSGQITLADIASEFGGSAPHAISEYYRGGGYVPNSGTNAGVPTSGQIAFSNFYGTAQFSGRDVTFTLGAGNETVPSGAVSVTIYTYGGGASGAQTVVLPPCLGGGTIVSPGGGGASVYSVYTIQPGDWGANLAYSVGAGGAYSTGGNAGATSSVSGTLVSYGGISMSAGGGQVGAGGSASGGNTANYNGGNGDTGTGAGGACSGGGSGGAYGGDGAVPGGGGGADGGSGARGQIRFVWS